MMLIAAVNSHPVLIVSAVFLLTLSSIHSRSLYQCYFRKLLFMEVFAVGLVVERADLLLLFEVSVAAPSPKPGYMLMSRGGFYVRNVIKIC